MLPNLHRKLAENGPKLRPDLGSRTKHGNHNCAGYRFRTFSRILQLPLKSRAGSSLPHSIWAWIPAVKTLARRKKRPKTRLLARTAQYGVAYFQ